MVIGLLVSQHRAKERDLGDLRHSLWLFYLNEEESSMLWRVEEGVGVRPLVPSASDSFETCWVAP